MPNPARKKPSPEAPRPEPPPRPLSDDKRPMSVQDPAEHDVKIPGRDDAVPADKTPPARTTRPLR